jgi:multidrug efflux system outer membrane protein
VDSVGIQVNYIVDFWGKYRRATEAARAQLLATTYGRDIVQTTLISDVATAYFRLRQFDYQLDFSQKDVTADTDAVRLNTIKYKGGDSAITDVYQAELLLQQAQAQVILSQQFMEQSENQISILLGRNPGPIPRGFTLNNQPHMAVVPTGLPSALIERRPDVRQSEAALMAANANVGVAKAAFFPQISLTGLFGATSTSLTSFLQGPATVWSLGGQALQPLYAGGAIRSAYDLAWAQRNEAELIYRQTVQIAFGDVANSLVGYNQARLYRMKIEEQTNTYRETADLANVRFAGGVTSFLEVLVTQQQYFTSQVTLAAAWNVELQNYVQLYQALGGGWQP